MENQERLIYAQTNPADSEKLQLDLGIRRPVILHSNMAFVIEIPGFDCPDMLSIRFVQGVGSPEIDAVVFKSLRKRNHSVARLKDLTDYFLDLKFDENRGQCIWEANGMTFTPLLLVKQCPNSAKKLGLLFTLQYTTDRYTPLPELLLFDYAEMPEELGLAKSPTWGR